MKKLVSLILASALVLSLAGCGGTAPSTPPSASGGASQAVSGDKKDPSSHTGKVMLYSSMQEDQILAIKEGFEKEYPNVSMDYYFAGTGKVITKIATENQSGQVASDVIWVGDPSDYINFKKEGILEKYTSPEAESIIPEFIDPEGYYTGARMMNMGIAYNTTKVPKDEVPSTWKGLLDSKWAKQIVMTDPGSAGTTKYFVSALMADKNYGKDYFAALRANGCELESGTTATHNQVAQGAYLLGVCLDYVTANLADKGSPIAFKYLDSDIVSIYSPIGLVAKSANQENGKLLYDYILSKKGQEILVANNLLSVRSDLEQAGVSMDKISKNSMKVDVQHLNDNSSSVLNSFDSIFKSH